MKKIWLEHYPPGIPAEIPPPGHSSLGALLEAAVSRHADRPSFSCGDRVLSYADLDELSRRFAAYLQHELELVRGDRLAIMLPNVLAYPVALFGALRAGIVVVNVNPLYTSRELEHQLVDSESLAIVILADRIPVLTEIIERTSVGGVVSVGARDLMVSPPEPRSRTLPREVTFIETLDAGGVFSPPDVTLSDTAFLQYTGGTTGRSKGAVLSHGNIVVNLSQILTWCPQLEEGSECIITALPLYHIFALTGNCFLYVALGGRNHLIVNPRDFESFVKELATVRFNSFTGVNTLFNGLLNSPGFADIDFSGLKLTIGGGMAVQRAVAERWKSVTGCSLTQGYGLTETSPVVCINPTEADFNGTIGPPIPSTECGVRGENGEWLEAGEVGELCIRGPQVMREYWRQPAETANVLDAEGWFTSGDLARMTEQGYFEIVDRKKDLIIVSGFNVFPNEIEEVAALHAGILEAAAVGVPDSEAGERVKLVVVRKDPQLTAGAIEDHCRGLLTPYKVPRHIEFRDELPKSNVGKVLRRQLRE